MNSPGPHQTAECLRLGAARDGGMSWKFWGPYLSERQWGTVREDYSPHGDAWEYFPHEMSRSRAYRWGEDGIAGLCDSQCRLCLSVVLWNERDPFLKERLFGLTNREGNHGEDVKELYYYLDATPTHSYLKMLYKYPQRAFPYAELLAENGRRSRSDPEFELLDTGLFDDDRYFDVFVEYAKAAPDDILMRITVHNRGPEAATIHILPQLWFRNTWSWNANTLAKPALSLGEGGCIEAVHPRLGRYRLFADQSPPILFCENETNRRRLFGVETEAGHFKDAFHDYLVDGQSRAVANGKGTKAAAHYGERVPAGKSVELRARLTRGSLQNPFFDFVKIFETRRREADEFFAELQEEIADPDARLVQRQALAGMIWCKQFFDYDVAVWIDGDVAQPPPPLERRTGRNHDWRHLNNADVISMPDKWEYPWYAAWDLAFHCIPLSLIDSAFAKSQLLLLTREWYMHPNGQLPAYEWNFSDVNPPVHAWAAWRVFQIDRKQRGDSGDLDFLERVFHKLMLNFTWWVNRKDAQGRNIFQGGFLGLDNIGVFDRSSPLQAGEYINQADGTSWMAMYCLNLMRIALELALENHVYEDIATKFFEHFLGIAEAMTSMGGGNVGSGLWDEEDQFYYDSLQLTHGRPISLKVRSMVGLIPLFAVETLEPAMLERLPDFKRRLEWVLKNRPEMARLVSRWNEPGVGERRLLSLLRGSRMKKLLKRMLDESEFLSDYGVRALSKYHAAHPYEFSCNSESLRVAYQPGESEIDMFGGNSNWRGPIWLPVNFLIIESLQKFHHYYGDDFKIECPTGSGRFLTIDGVAQHLQERLTRLFLRDAAGRRAAFGDHPKLQHDPHFRDYILFYEYFHGETGRGAGASHQTGWTGLVAKLLQPRRAESSAALPADGRAATPV
ncbi:MAG TPA: glucosidase [Planctomycetaceae bacterium]|nr:glucosidase [Planctomycetaceae bacterium]